MRQFISLLISSILMLSSSTGFAAELCSSLFVVDPLLITARIEKNKFTTSRDIYDYQQLLYEDFMPTLNRLTPDQHWIDLGAGKAKAQIDYLKSKKAASMAAQTTAVAYKLDRWFAPSKFNGKLEVKEGAFEIQDTAQWKKADLITDLFGVISYSRDLHTSFQKIFDLLNVHGELYIYSTAWTTRFVNKAGSTDIQGFLSSIEGLQVEGKFGTIKVTKMQEKIQIPELTLSGFRDDSPPARSFTIEQD